MIRLLSSVAASLFAFAALAHDDDGDIASRPVGENAGNAAPIGSAYEDSPRTLKDVRVPLARQTNRRRVNNGHQFIRMIH